MEISLTFEYIVFLYFKLTADGCHFELNIRKENYGTQFISQNHVYS